MVENIGEDNETLESIKFLANLASEISASVA
jgi:hypothetical protein